MCGIAGLMTRDGSPPPRSILEKLSAALTHRGPDGNGLHIAGDCGLVHRRLAIIDVAGGAQPLVAAPDDVSVVVNGEIYNDPELRRDLWQVRFATGSGLGNAAASLSARRKRRRRV